MKESAAKKTAQGKEEGLEDLSHLAVSEDGEEMELSPDDLEEVGEGRMKVSMESRVSKAHTDRNDDKLTTEKPDWDNANIAKLAEKESKVAGKLADRGVFGTFDGVSAGGAGVLASRIASGAIAERMAALPQDANTEASRKAIEEAIKAAHADVLRYRQDRPDLKNMSATADVIRTIDNGDGTFDVAYGHVGDSRIYVFDEASGKLERQTEDESMASLLHRGGLMEMEGLSKLFVGGEVTKDELDQIMAGESTDVVKNESARGMLKAMRNPLLNAVGFPTKNFAVKTGVIKAKAGQRVYVMTDGVHGTLSESQIADVLRAGGGQKELMDTASKSRDEKKNHDDISIVEVGLKAEATSSAKAAPRGETAALHRAAKDSREEATALEALLANADNGDMDALNKVKDKYKGRENVNELILTMKSRALSKEEAALRGEGGPRAETRLKKIAEERSVLRGEMQKQISRHEQAISDARNSLDEAYGDTEDITGEFETLRVDDDAAAKSKKKPFWKKIIGGK